MSSSKEMEEYLAARNYVGNYENDLYSCFCSDPVKPKTTLIKTPTVANTVDTPKLVVSAEPVPVIRTIRPTNQTVVSTPIRTTQPAPGTSDLLTRVPKALEDTDIVDDVVVKTKDNGQMVVTDTPSNVDLVDSPTEPKKTAGGWLMWVLVAAGIGLAFTGTRETKVVEA